MQQIKSNKEGKWCFILIDLYRGTLNKQQIKNLQNEGGRWSYLQLKLTKNRNDTDEYFIWTETLKAELRASTVASLRLLCRSVATRWSAPIGAHLVTEWQKKDVPLLCWLTQENVSYEESNVFVKVGLCKKCRAWDERRRILKKTFFIERRVPQTETVSGICRPYGRALLLISCPPPEHTSQWAMVRSSRPRVMLKKEDCIEKSRTKETVCPGSIWRVPRQIQLQCHQRVPSHSSVILSGAQPYVF